MGREQKISNILVRSPGITITLWQWLGTAGLSSLLHDLAEWKRAQPLCSCWSHLACDCCQAVCQCSYSSIAGQRTVLLFSQGRTETHSSGWLGGRNIFVAMEIVCFCFSVSYHTLLQLHPHLLLLKIKIWLKGCPLLCPTHCIKTGCDTRTIASIMQRMKCLVFLMSTFLLTSW